MDNGMDISTLENWLWDAARNDYNLSHSRYVATGEKEEYLPVDEVLVEFEQVEEERKEIDEELDEILRLLGFGG